MCKLSLFQLVQENYSVRSERLMANCIWRLWSQSLVMVMNSCWQKVWTCTLKTQVHTYESFANTLTDTSNPIHTCSTNHLLNVHTDLLSQQQGKCIYTLLTKMKGGLCAQRSKIIRVSFDNSVNTLIHTDTLKIVNQLCVCVN